MESAHFILLDLKHEQGSNSIATGASDHKKNQLPQFCLCKLPEPFAGVGVHLWVSPAKVRLGGAGSQVTPGEEAVEEDHDDDQEHDADTDADQEGGARVTRVLLRDEDVWVIPARSEARGILRWTDGKPPELLLSDQAPWLVGILK